MDNLFNLAPKLYRESPPGLKTITVKTITVITEI